MRRANQSGEQSAARLVIALLVVAMSVVAGCASDAADRADTTSDDSRAALIVCDALRKYDNGLVDVVNDSVATINSSSPDERRSSLDAGLTAVVDVVTQWQRTIVDLELPDIAEADQLRDQLANGTVDALDALADQADDAGKSGPIADDDVQGQVGIWFNSVEKVMSVSEPEIFVLERADLKQAFLDEPNCRNVIQQFVND